MRAFDLLARKNGNDRPDIPLHDQDLLLQAAYSAEPQGGSTYEEADKACRLADKIRADRNRLQLEEADWGFLCHKFKVMRWNTSALDPEILRLLGKTLLEAPEVKVIADQPAA